MCGQIFIQIPIKSLIKNQMARFDHSLYSDKIQVKCKLGIAMQWGGKLNTIYLQSL